MPRVLASWIGHADLRAVNENATAGVGPVAQALDSGRFDTAFLLTDHDITADELEDALLAPVRDHSLEVLNRTLGDGFSLPDLLEEVAHHYLARALEEASNNKTRAAELVGLASYQTFTNWLAKYAMPKDGTVHA